MPGVENQTSQHIRVGHAGTVGGHTPRQWPAYGKMCTIGGMMGLFSKVCRSRRNCIVHEVEIEVGLESQGEDIEIMSVISLHLNRKCSPIPAHLKMQSGKTALEIPYKINTGSEGNLMPLYIF